MKPTASVNSGNVQNSNKKKYTRTQGYRVTEQSPKVANKSFAHQKDAQTIVEILETTRLQRRCKCDSADLTILFDRNSKLVSSQLLKKNLSCCHNLHLSCKKSKTSPT